MLITVRREAALIEDPSCSAVLAPDVFTGDRCEVQHLDSSTAVIDADSGAP